VSSYEIAIDLTTHTINSRAEYFRNLVVSFVPIALTAIGWWILASGLGLLLTLFLLVSACATFFAADTRVLLNWRNRLLSMWISKEIDFYALHHSLRALPNLPKNTLEGMLSTLPAVGDLVAEHSISPATREAVAATVTSVHASESDFMMLKAVAVALASAAAGGSIVLRTWRPLLMLPVILAALPALRIWLKGRRMKVADEVTAAACEKPDFNFDTYRELTAPQRVADQKGTRLVP
jgi:hypothetical protein